MKIGKILFVSFKNRPSEYLLQQTSLVLDTKLYNKAIVWWGKTSDNAIILRDNTGSDILIDIIISLESNLHLSEEDHCILKKNPTSWYFM